MIRKGTKGKWQILNKFKFDCHFWVQPSLTRTLLDLNTFTELQWIAVPHALDIMYFTDINSLINYNCNIIVIIVVAVVLLLSGGVKHQENINYFYSLNLSMWNLSPFSESCKYFEIKLTPLILYTYSEVNYSLPE